MKENSLTPLEQREVEFYGDNLLAIRANDGHVYVAIKQMCDALGIDGQGQRRRMERHVVISKGLKGIDKLSTPGGLQSAYVLRVDLVPLWLSGIRVKAVREDMQEKLTLFQEEAAKVLWEAFQEGRLSIANNEPGLEELARLDPDAVEALMLARAVVKLAQSHLRVVNQVENNTQRIENLESIVGSPDRMIIPAQASQISQAIKAVAMALSKNSGRNEYGGVYGEFYRQFEVTSYKLLPASRFNAAMTFLNEWLQSLIGDSPF